MDRKTVFIVVVSASVLLLAITAVTAHNRTVNIPLYTLRMEQVSSEMNFLPTEMNSFTYTAENGYNLNCVAPTEFCGAKPLDIFLGTLGGPTCELFTTKHTCEDEECIWTGAFTCPHTCFDTCWGTCSWC